MINLKPENNQKNRIFLVRRNSKSFSRIKDFFDHENSWNVSERSELAHNSLNFRWKRLIFVLFLVLLISISGCKGKKDVKKALEEIRTGTEGIVLNFLPNAPPATIHVEKGIPPETFDVVLEVKNKGAYPQPDEGIGGLGPLLGKVYLSGYDQNILVFTPSPPVAELTGRTLEGKSTINPNGGQDLVVFKVNVNVENLNVEKYEPILLATACYNYFTIAGPSVCIDPNPYSTVKEKKVCEVQDVTLTNQGAPIAVTKIGEEAFATKTQFKITVKNVGGGDVIKREAFEKCNPFGSDKIGREDIDKVYLYEVKISDKTLDCGPFAEGNKGKQGYIRLINGEGFVICELRDYGGSKTAYTTPLRIWLSYNYINTAERKLQIKMETSGLGGVSPESGSNYPQPNIPIEQQYGP